MWTSCLCLLLCQIYIIIVYRMVMLVDATRRARFATSGCLVAHLKALLVLPYPIHFTFICNARCPHKVHRWANLLPTYNILVNCPSLKKIMLNQVQNVRVKLNGCLSSLPPFFITISWLHDLMKTDSPDSYGRVKHLARS
jgi:hypothetical protein